MWAASASQFPDVARDDVRRVRKRPDVNTLGITGRVITAGGPFKALDIPVPTKRSPYVDFHAVGDRERLSALLPLIHGLARGRSGGLGAVTGWEVLDAQGPALWHDTPEGKRPMRPLPVESPEAAAETYAPLGYSIAVRGVRPPYWHHAIKTLAVIP